MLVDHLNFCGTLPVCITSIKDRDNWTFVYLPQFIGNSGWIPSKPGALPGLISSRVFEISWHVNGLSILLLCELFFVTICGATVFGLIVMCCFHVEAALLSLSSNVQFFLIDVWKFQLSTVSVYISCLTASSLWSSSSAIS